ncbi:5-carboxymethyl-2-hydroxymuconate Delta-isomerase [Defluviimonas sp. WL0002]|uniref:5-carboxymethyl-2-hydroxymuconate Delta-isomerase n=1 Tax=Albidovulum marisflavi TaxID=2984159 RepID=A0ABT2ZGQ7_9RHOB|nr:5-carboxymethyl-2-hydroxymuconate Delta-isomerase [Defluviimonas sp. WL0002]MCV2870305.1 5-carboxymethyl-2-hydroxymuconate Delta-isomerase [Defluviimonas sp. WL0002]
MPHFHIEYSANLDEVVDMAQLCEAIRAEAAAIDAFPMPGIRVRATRVDHYAIADGSPEHGFIDLSVRIREGRTDDVKHDAIARVFATLKAFLAPAMATHSIALSAELRDIDAALSLKFGNIRDHLRGDT